MKDPQWVVVQQDHEQDETWVMGPFATKHEAQVRMANEADENKGAGDLDGDGDVYLCVSTSDGGLIYEWEVQALIP